MSAFKQRARPFKRAFSLSIGVSVGKDLEILILQQKFLLSPLKITANIFLNFQFSNIFVLFSLIFFALMMTAERQLKRRHIYYCLFRVVLMIYYENNYTPIRELNEKKLRQNFSFQVS